MGITIRTKPIQGGKLRLYLDFYPPITNPATGKQTRREFLKLYVHSDVELVEDEYLTKTGNVVQRITQALDKNNQPKKRNLDKIQRNHNKETYQLAENIKAQRQLQIQAEDYGFITIDKKADFLTFFQGIADKYKNERNNNNYHSTLRYLINYTGGKCYMNDITPGMCESFRDYLLTVKAVKVVKAVEKKNAPLSSNTASVYFSNFLYGIKQAAKKGYIDKSLTQDIKRITLSEAQREFLTYDELRELAKMPFDMPLLKRACLFSALTGLRWSDIYKLKWGEVVEDSGKYSIRFITKKTDTAQTLAISNEAYAFLGDRGKHEETIFGALKYSGWMNGKIDKWVRSAGINKHITFHCFRHTFATLQITLGTDIYTVSKMLGHTNVGVTQIYAKIIDQKKRDAVEKITLQ